MWKKRTVDFIIIVFIKLCSCDDFFIVNQYERHRYYCITNSSSALSWIKEDIEVSSDLQQVSTFLPKLENIWDIEDEMKKNKWKYEKILSREVILDRRWEHMKIYKTDEVYGTKGNGLNLKLKFTTVNTYLTTNFDIPFSIRIKNEAHIFLCDGADVTNSNCYWIIFLGFSGQISTIRKCPRNTIPSFTEQRVKIPCDYFKTIVDHNSLSQIHDQGLWNHFRLSKVGNTLALTLPDSTPIVSYSDPEYVFNVTRLKIHSKKNIGLWKFHEIGYYFTDIEEMIKFQKPIQIINESICISMFAKMCKSCTIKLEISGRDNPNMRIKKMFTGEVSRWQEIKLQSTNFISNEIYLTLTTKNRYDPSPYWKIGDITQCGKNNVRMIQSNEMADCQLVSHKTAKISLNESNQIEEAQFLESFDCRENEVGRFCIPCGWFTDDGCTHMKICQKFDQNTQCFCYAGYRIKNGPCSRCNDGYYGYCSSCIDNYSGPKCDKLDPRYTNGLNSDLNSNLYGLFALLLVIPLVVVIYIKRDKLRSIKNIVFKRNNESTGRMETQSDQISSSHLAEANVNIKAPRKPRNVMHKEKPSNVQIERKEELEYLCPVSYIPNAQKIYKDKTSDRFSKKVDMVNFEEYIGKAEISGELDVQYYTLKKYQSSTIYMEIRDNQYFDYVDIEFSKDYILPKVYILADVPKINSINKFWKIIWEENVCHIIFLASTKEQTSKQFYSNSDEKMKYGSISVQMIFSKRVDNYIERTFILIKNEELRKVHKIEFAYQGLNSSQFVSFLKKMSTFPLSTSSPIFIHSSDIKRSGFILLCDMSLRMAAEYQATDVWKNLKQLSDHRMDMFCNIELYKFAHLVVLKTVFWREFTEDYIS